MPSDPFAGRLDLAGRRVLVCGGGPAALAPIRALLEAGAEVTVVGSEISTTMADLAARNRLRIHTRALRADDLDGIALVVPAGEAAADQQALQLARALSLIQHLTLPTTPYV